MTLNELLELVHPKRELHIGCATGFIYFGTHKSFKEYDIKLLNKYYKTKFGDREVKEIFPSLLTRALGILLEGDEVTAIGSMDDYRRFREDVLKKQKRKKKKVDTLE